MIIIVAQVIFCLSILGILYFLFRRIPDLLEYPRYSSKIIPMREKISIRWQKIKENTETSEFLHKFLIPKTEKFLRKTKIIVLKFDNFLARRVDGLRQRMKRRKEK